MKRITPALFLLVVLFFPLALLAGKVEFRDEASLLPAPARSQIIDSARPWLFGLRVLTSTTAADRAAFERRASAAVSSPDMVVVAIDPVHRYVVVRLGSGLGMDPGQYTQIASAGNENFKLARWAAGIAEIGGTAERKAQLSRYLRDTERAANRPERFSVVPASQVVAASSPAAASSSHESSIGWLLLGLIVTLIVVCVVGMLIARRRERLAAEAEADRLVERETERILAADRKREQREIAEMTAAPAAPMPSRYENAYRSSPTSVSYERPRPISREPARVYVSPSVQPAPVVVHHHDSTGDGLLTGMLLGEAMHSHHHDHSDRHVVERVVEREPARSSYDGGGSSSSFDSSPEPESYSHPPAASSYDGGGSSSSWDSGSSSSSSSDSSSSGSYDGGSSSSFDSGGGSSDF